MQSAPKGSFWNVKRTVWKEKNMEDKEDCIWYTLQKLGDCDYVTQ